MFPATAPQKPHRGRSAGRLKPCHDRKPIRCALTPTRRGRETVAAPGITRSRSWPSSPDRPARVRTFGDNNRLPRSQHRRLCARPRYCPGHAGPAAEASPKALAGPWAHLRGGHQDSSHCLRSAERAWPWALHGVRGGRSPARTCGYLTPACSASSPPARGPRTGSFPCPRATSQPAWAPSRSI